MYFQSPRTMHASPKRNMSKEELHVSAYAGKNIPETRHATRENFSNE